MVSAKVNNVYAICAFAAIGGGLFGFDISSMSGVLGTNAYKNYFDNPQDTRVRYQYSNNEEEVEYDINMNYSKVELPVLCQLGL